MNTRPHRWAFGLYFLPLAVLAGSTPEQMAARAKNSLSRNSAYEMVSVQEFWGDASYLASCTGKNKPLPKPFTIYFEVLPNGQLGELLFVPETDVTRCIRPNVAGRRFTKPPGTYVTKIEMSFQ